MKRPKCPCTKTCEKRACLGYLCRQECKAYLEYEEAYSEFIKAKTKMMENEYFKRKK